MMPRSLRYPPLIRFVAVAFVVTVLGLVATRAEAHHVGDLVFCDNNSNGIFDTGDTGVSGATVVRNCGVNGTFTTTTDSNGRYSFPGNVVESQGCDISVDQSSGPLVGKAITTPLLGIRPTSQADVAEHSPFGGFGCSTCTNAFVNTVVADGKFHITINNPCDCVDTGCTTDPCPGTAPFIGYFGDDFGFLCIVPTTTTSSTTTTTTTTSTSTSSSTTETTAPEPPVTTTTTTTSSTTILTTTSTSTTVSSTTSSSTTVTSTSTTLGCVPTPEVGHCADMIDNDCDGLIDCADSDCKPATCEGGTQDGESCASRPAQAACTGGGGTCICAPIRSDPTTIVFGPAGAGHDVLTSHGRVIIPGPTLDIANSDVGWLLNNAQGRIFSAVLPAGSLKPDQSGKLFRYVNPDARTSGGIYKVQIRARRIGTSYGYRVQAFGDLSGAADPNMALQFYIAGQPTPAIHNDVWIRRPYGWRTSHFD